MLKIKWKNKDLTPHIRWELHMFGVKPLAFYSVDESMIWLDWIILRNIPLILIVTFFHEIGHFIFCSLRLWKANIIYDNLDRKYFIPIVHKFVRKKYNLYTLK